MLFTYDRARHFAENSLWELQHTNHFEVIIPDYYKVLLDSSLSDTAPNNQLKMTQGILDSANLKMAVKSISMPSLSFDVDEIVNNNIRRKIPHSPKCGDATIVFYDAIGINVEKMIMDWYEKIFEPRKEKLGYTFEYKIDMYVLQFSGENTYMRAWLLKKCFPKEISIPDFSYDGADLKTITVNFAVEYAYPLTEEEYIALMAHNANISGSGTTAVIGIAGL